MPARTKASTVVPSPELPDVANTGGSSRAPSSGLASESGMGRTDSSASTELARRKIDKLDELSGGLVFGKYEKSAKQRYLEAERELREQAERKELEQE